MLAWHALRDGRQSKSQNGLLNTTNRKITVALWSGSQDPVPERRAHQRLWPPSAIGLAGTLLMHSLVIQSALLGSRAHEIRSPEVQDTGSSPKKPTTSLVDALVFIDIPKTIKNAHEIYEAPGPVWVDMKHGPIPVIHPDPPPPIDVEAITPSDDKSLVSLVDSGDGAELTRLFGIYSGQIQARIDRVWRRPQTPVNEGSDTAMTANAVEYFRCQVQILQDSSGNVQEILLPNCNGSVAWQRSLVLAIQQASPLPAPPSPTVYSHTVALNFVAYP